MCIYSHTFVIKPDFDDQLREIKAKLDVCRDTLDEEHQRVADDIGSSVTLHWEKHSLYGYCFRLTRRVSI